MKDVLRHLASSVSVVTAAHRRELAGMTISSLSSLSIRPNPLVSLNMQIPSRTSRLIEASGGSFIVNILNAERESVDLAKAFAGLTSKGHDFNPFEAFPRCYTLTEDGIPLLNCASSYLVCDVVKLVPIQDHELIIAQVRDAAYRGGQPLVYHNHAFRKIR